MLHAETLQSVWGKCHIQTHAAGSVLISEMWPEIACAKGHRTGELLNDQIKASFAGIFRIWGVYLTRIQSFSKFFTESVGINQLIILGR